MMAKQRSAAKLQSAASQPVEKPTLEITGSSGFSSWLIEQKTSFIFTTYETGKVFLIGMQPDARVSIFERTFNRCMGLCGNAQTFYMSSQYQIWRFDNALDPGQSYEGYDRLYVPQTGYTTGDIDTHDMAIDGEGHVIFINTLFSCLARLSESHSFKPLWKPKFISKLTAEDRCHLNGLAMVEGKPKYITAVSRSDADEGWRERRVDGGIVMDIETDEIIAERLSMPHSPRWYRNQLYILNSGTGYFGTLDVASGKFEPITFCPGYARGLSFMGDFAIVALSTIRDNWAFADLPISDELTKRKLEAHCGIQIIDLRSGDVVHTMHIGGIVRELYDVLLLPGVLRPMALGFKTDEIHHTISLESE